MLDGQGVGEQVLLCYSVTLSRHILSRFVCIIVQPLESVSSYGTEAHN